MLKRPDLGTFSFEITPAGESALHVPLRTRLSSIVRDSQRTVHLIRLDLKQQVFGLSLGHLWLLLEPALQAGAYYFLLTVVFGMRGSDSTFAFFLVAIIFWRSHALLTTSAPAFLVTKGRHYIDQGFGLNIAFLEFAAQELVLFTMRFTVLLFFLVVAGYTPHVSWLAALFVGACMFCFTLSLAIWLAMAGTLFKDSSKFIGHFVWMWWYLSPGLYSITRIPYWAEPIFALNPFTYIIPAAHAALLGYDFTAAHFFNNLLLAVVSLLFMVVGWRLMKRFGYVLAQYV
jgi:lipopolysaccharide transport system permease protein